jgi:GWxTD domain-containing protein
MGMDRPGKTWRMAGLLLLCLLSTGCAGRARAKAEVAALEAWANGPVRWLMLPEERRRLHDVHNAAGAAAFRAAFWARRERADRDAGEPSFRRQFEESVRAADLLYGEPGRRGSLSDRGGALILLGSPTGLQRTVRQVLIWDPDRRPGERRKRRRVPAEVWIYSVDELPPRLRARFAREGRRQITLTFVFERGGVHLQEGEKFLHEAAKAFVNP